MHLEISLETTSGFYVEVRSKNPHFNHLLSDTIKKNLESDLMKDLSYTKYESGGPVLPLLEVREILTLMKTY